MSTLWMACGGITLATLAAGYLMGVLTERWRTDRQADEDRAAVALEKIAANRREARYAPRHDAKSQPRADERPRPPAAVPSPGPVELPRGGAIGVMLDKQAGQPWRFPVSLGSHTAASHISTVLLAPQAAPDLREADDTGTMPRVPGFIDIATSGELRKLTDEEFIAALEATA